MAYSVQRQRLTSPKQEPTTRIRGFASRDDIRMVLLGKTGNGKSASGNTILGRNAFLAERSPTSVTQDCEKFRGVVAGHRVAIIDTPGIYDTKYKEHMVTKKLRDCISLSAPGPHVFLIVINLDRFTKEEQKTVTLLQMVFGEKAEDYSLVLFTHGDQLGNTTIEDFFSKSDRLNHLITRCKRRYHVLNNTVSDEGQVRQLLDKIVSMVHDNGGTFYTNEMFQEAERAIQEKAKKIMRASAEQKQREEEKLKARFEGEQLQEKLNQLQEGYKTKAREKAEKRNKFLKTGLVLTGAEVGVAIGLAAGTAGGPICMGIGAAVGGVTGALVGLLAPPAVKALTKKCVMQ